MINGIYFLSSKDFDVQDSIDGKLLSLNADIKGLNLVLFYSNECKYCDEVITEFKKLPHHIFGCSFSMINLNQNPNVTSLSRDTITKLTYVPELILFLDNLPYSKFEGEAKLEEIQTFIREVSKNLENHSFTRNVESNLIKEEVQIKDELPHCKKSKKVCYIQENYI